MSIATSRALGDFEFKSNPSRQPEEQMISPVPELYTRERWVNLFLLLDVAFEKRVMFLFAPVVFRSHYVC